MFRLHAPLFRQLVEDGASDSLDLREFLSAGGVPFDVAERHELGQRTVDGGALREDEGPAGYGEHALKEIRRRRGASQQQDGHEGVQDVGVYGRVLLARHGSYASTALVLC